MFNNKKNNRIIADVIILAVFILTVATACLMISRARIERVPDYSSRDSWAYFAEGEDKDADLFLIAPTVYTGDRNNMSVGEKKSLSNFVAALNMERGIYEDDCRMYAPFYRQAAMSVYDLNSIDREEYLELAYEDISNALNSSLRNSGYDYIHFSLDGAKRVAELTKIFQMHSDGIWKMKTMEGP